MSPPDIQPGHTESESMIATLPKVIAVVVLVLLAVLAIGRCGGRHLDVREAPLERTGASADRTRSDASEASTGVVRDREGVEEVSGVGSLAAEQRPPVPGLGYPVY